METIQTFDITKIIGKKFKRVFYIVIFFEENYIISQIKDILLRL